MTQDDESENSHFQEANRQKVNIALSLDCVIQVRKGLVQQHLSGVHLTRKKSAVLLTTLENLKARRDENMQIEIL